MFGGTAIPFGDTPTNIVYRYDLSAKYEPLSNQSDTPPRDDEDYDNYAEPNEREVIQPSVQSRWKVIPVEGDVPEERYGHVRRESCFSILIF